MGGTPGDLSQLYDTCRQPRSHLFVPYSYFLSPPRDPSIFHIRKEKESLVLLLWAASRMTPMSPACGSSWVVRLAVWKPEAQGPCLTASMSRCPHTL